MTDNAVMNTYGKLAVSFENGDGSWLFDTDGNKYFDTFTGVAVSGLGHSNPAVAKAIKQQCTRLLHSSNIFHSKLQQQLSQKLCELSGLNKVFLCNSGLEANETAIKIARKHAYDQGNHSPVIITFKNSFHGRSLATISASGNDKIKHGFGPLVDGFIHLKLNDSEALHSAFEQNANIAAVMLEPIQGEGGIHLAETSFLKTARELCSKHSALLICDEIQTANARTGKYFAYQHANIQPDIVTLAKGLGNGFPIGACISSDEAANSLIPGSHGSTFGGNPLACAAAMAVIEEIQSKHLEQRAESLGQHIKSALEDALLGADYVADIRGKGLMIGIEMTDPCFALVPLAKEKGILLNVTSDNVIRLLPTLTLSDEECDFLIDAVIQIVRLYAADDRAQPRAK